MVKKLLFVDDELEFQEGIKKCFQVYHSSEYKVLFAETGEEALTTVKKNKDIDLILTDLKMPSAKIEGIEFLQILNKQNINIKTVVISAYGNIENYTESIKNHAFLFITKPLNLLKLKNLIDEIFAQDDIVTSSSINRINFQQILKAIRRLSSEEQVNLLIKTIEILKTDSLKVLNKELPETLNKKIENTKKNLKVLEDELPHLLNQQKENKQIKQQQIKELLQQIKEGKINQDSSFEVLGRYEILERFIPQDENKFGPYYYLRYWDSENQKRREKYLGKKVPEVLLKDFQQKQLKLN